MFLAQDPFVSVAIGIAVVFALTVLALSRISNLWMQAFMSGTPILAIDLLRMLFRKIDPKVVVKAMIKAKQSGVVLSREQLEKAYLQGADLDKLTLALIQAKRQDLQITFEELVDADLSDQLAEKLNAKRNDAVSH